MKKIKIYFALAAMSLLAACENDPLFMGDEAFIRMEGPEVWTLGTDSLEFSFANYSSTVTDTTFMVAVYVSGQASDMDRTAEFAVNTALTTAEANLYSFPSSVVIPAGSYSAILPVTINRGEVLQSETVKLDVLVKANDDFSIGVNEQNHLLVKWNDVLSKPLNWSSLTEFFGEYSLVKYRFIIDVLNMGTFDTDTLTWAQLKNYQIVLAEALRVYNEAHPGSPLKDENDKLITF